jgi:hypothetical protein
MGRNFTFSYKNIPKPKPIANGIDSIPFLKEGSTVLNLLMRLGVVNDEFTLPLLRRCPSNYGFEESNIASNIIYIVDNDNCDTTLFAETGLRAIALRDTTIPKDEHIATWVITTDGYVRNNEDYGIIGYIDSITVSD